MELSEIASVTGLPGLFKIASRRADGVIVTSLVDGKTQFVSGRNHLFTTLDNITMYTTGEAALLKDVLASIKKQEGSHPVPDTKNDADLKKWLEAVLPDYDKEKVHVSDMKKLAKWYSLLNEKNLIEELTSEKKTEEKGGAEEKTEKKEHVKESKPVKENKPKAIKSAKGTKASTKPAPSAQKITAPRKAQ
jgi:Domain of unknown function (DUF5606)